MSLRVRLALWYGGLSALTMLLVCALIYVVHSRTHYDDLDRALVSAAGHIAREYASADHPEMLSVPVAPQIVARVYGPGGQLLAAAPNAAAAPATDPATVLAQPGAPAYGPLVRLAPSLVTIDPAGARSASSAGRTGRAGASTRSPSAAPPTSRRRPWRNSTPRSPGCAG